MNYCIENEWLKVTIKEFGCEISSIYSKADGFEYLWQGNPDVWSGQAPILFPIIGRLLNDRYSFNKKEYEMQKHGFARKMQWSFLSRTEDSISFILSDNDETMKVYPFHFDLIVTYILKGNKLTVKHEVINKNDTTMYFSLGAHPAFRCKVGDKLVFDQNENLDVMKIDLVNSLLLDNTVPFLQNEKAITITDDLFNEDALIFKNVKSENITLFSDSFNKKIKFNLGKAPYLGIWAKPKAEYVCIEPWFGVNDSHEKKDDISKKVGINPLSPESHFEFCWSAEFSE